VFFIFHKLHLPYDVQCCTFAGTFMCHDTLFSFYLNSSFNIFNEANILISQFLQPNNTVNCFSPFAAYYLCSFCI